METYSYPNPSQKWSRTSTFNADGSERQKESINTWTENKYTEVLNQHDSRISYFINRLDEIKKKGQDLMCKQLDLERQTRELEIEYSNTIELIRQVQKEYEKYSMEFENYMRNYLLTNVVSGGKVI